MRILKIIFYLILIVFPFGQLPRFEVWFLPGVTLHLIDLLTFLFILCWLTNNVGVKKLKSIPHFFKEMAIFALVAVFSLVVNIPNYGLSLSSVFYLLRLINYFVFYWAVRDLFSKETIPVFKILFYEGVAISILSILLYVFIPDMRFLFNLGWDLHYYRAIGPFLDPAFTGLVCVLSLLVLLTTIKAVHKKEKIINAAGGFLLLLAISITFSRMAYGALIVGLMMVFWRKSWKGMLVFLLIFVFFVLIIPKPSGEGVDLFRKSSFLNRFNNYKQTVTIIKNNFVLGVGYNNFRFALRKYGYLPGESWEFTHSGSGADNSFLFVLATTGLFGLVAYILFWFRIVSDSVRKKSTASFLVLATSVCLLFSSFMINSLFYSWILLWLMIILAKSTAEVEK